MVTISIRDESMNGETIRELDLEIPAEQISIEELIRSRVFQEVKESNARMASGNNEPNPSVRRSEFEALLNGPRARSNPPVEWQSQFEKALKAFRSNQVLILIDGEQANSLDQIVDVSTSTRISFLRLTMLMGG